MATRTKEGRTVPHFSIPPNPPHKPIQIGSSSHRSRLFVEGGRQRFPLSDQSRTQSAQIFQLGRGALRLVG